MYTSGFFVFFFSFLAGFIPPLIWLGFWLREDKLHPEPKKILVTTFFAGMIGTILALIFEELVKILGGFTNESQSFLLMTIWVAIEETMKYLMAFSAALWRKENDEPIDNMIYLITAAIGFSSLENLLYLLDPFRTGNILEGVITGNLRFLGTTPLHLLSSAIIGIAMAYAFGKLGVKTVLLGSAAGTDPETLAFASERDAALAVSFTPYAPATLQHARQLAERAVPLVVVTDSPFSPLVSPDAICFEVAEADYQGFRSLSATMALAMTLTVAVAERHRSA